MNVAVILAGGTGSRMGGDVPKQYVEVLGKPVIVYTMERFEAAKNIDAIEVVVRNEYENYVIELGKKYNITKLKWVATAGESCQQSISNGVFALEDKNCSKGDIVVIHMSVSPLVNEYTIDEGIRLCKRKGNAFPIHQNLFQLCVNMGDTYSEINAYKDDFWALNMPWNVEFETIDRLYHTAYSQGLGMDARSYLPSLMFEMHMGLYLYPDNEENRLKITNKCDLDFFEGWLRVHEFRKRKR